MSKKDIKSTKSKEHKIDENPQIQLIKEIASISSRAEKSRKTFVGAQTAYYKV